MKQQVVIGITGATAAGKTTIAEHLGFYRNVLVLNADKIAHRMLVTSEILDVILKRWHLEYDADENTFRHKVADIVFKDEKELEFLEGLIFPAVKEEMKEVIDDNPNKIIIIDAPMLFESGCDRLCTHIWFVNMSKEERYANYKERNREKEESLVKADFDARESRQMPLAEKIKRSDKVIENHYSALEDALDAAGELFDSVF